MVYYSTQLYFSYGQEEIRSATAYMNILIEGTTMLGKPVAGIIEHLFGSIIGIVVMGIAFFLIMPTCFIGGNSADKT